MTQGPSASRKKKTKKDKKRQKKTKKDKKRDNKRGTKCCPDSWGGGNIAFSQLSTKIEDTLQTAER